jgi:hypothetical protein
MKYFGLRWGSEQGLYGYSIFGRWKMLYVGKIKFTEQHIIHTFRHQEIESAIQDIAYRS